jgi:hypothetical protein
LKETRTRTTVERVEVEKVGNDWIVRLIIGGGWAKMFRWDTEQEARDFAEWLSSYANDRRRMSNLNRER